MDWSGESHSRTVDVPYQRNPREFIPPLSEELQIIKNADGAKVVASRLFVNDETSAKRIFHVINLFLEIFGECEILKKDLIPVVPTIIKRLNRSSSLLAPAAFTGIWFSASLERNCTF